MVRNKLLLKASCNIICLLALSGVIGFQSLILAQESSKHAFPDPLAISQQDKLKVFEKLWETVNKRYFDPKFNGVNWEQIKIKYRPQVEAAINKNQLKVVLQKMLDELLTSHLSVWFNVKLRKEHLKQEIGRKVNRGESFQFDPGIKLVPIEGRSVVNQVADGSGAQLAGVQRGWMLIDWNGEPYRRDQNIACDPGEKISLRFLDLQGQERKLDVVCKLYPTPNRLSERISRRLNGGAVYLRFTGFAPGINDWLVGEVKSNLQAPAIIIDLRGNGGGLITVLRKCFVPFFSDARILGEFRDRHGKEPTLKAGGRGKRAYSGRVFVLIDEISASGAEIFAAGLHDSGRGIIIGRQSSGKVLSSYEQGLPNGFRAKIAFCDYQTAKGIRLEGHGVIPDEPVTLTMKDFLENRDTDLERVSQVLQKAH